MKTFFIFRLQKSTPEDNEDHHLLLQVCEQLDFQTKYLNDSIAEIEFKVKVSLLIFLRQFYNRKIKSKSLEYDKSFPHKAHEAPEGATRLLFNGIIKGKKIIEIVEEIRQS